MEYTMEQLRMLISSMTGYVVIYEVQDAGSRLRPLLYTPEVPGFSGLSEQEYLDLYGSDASAVVADRDMPALAVKLQKLADHEGDQEATYRTFHKTKGFVWTHVKLRLLGTCNGHPLIIGNFDNVTDRMESSDILLNHSDQKIYVIERDSFDLLYANAAAMADKESLPAPGQTCYQYIRKQSVPCPNCVAYGIHGEEPLETIWKDPQRQRTYRVKAVPMHFFEKLAYAFFIDDLTDHIDLEKALQQEQEKYRAATEGANLRVYEYEIAAHTLILPEHSRKLFGVSSCVVRDVPETILPLFHPEDRERVRAFFDRVSAGEHIVTAEFEMNPVNDYSAFLRYTFTTTYDQAGKPVMAYAVAEDITAQKRAESDFNETIQAMLYANPNALCSYRIDLSRNLCSEGHGVSRYIQNLLRSDTAGELFSHLLSIIPDPRQKATAAEFFDRSRLLKAYAEGSKALHLDYQRADEHGRILWVRTFVNMLKNPSSDDIIAVFYSLDITDEIRRNQVLNIITGQEYDYAALLHIREKTIEFLNVNPHLPERYQEKIGHIGRQFSFDGMREYTASTWIAEEDRDYYLGSSGIDMICRSLDRDGHYEMSVRGHAVGHENELMCRKIQHYYLGEDHDSVLIVQIDVTETYRLQQKEAQEIRAEADRVMDILDSLSCGICVLRMPDPDHLLGDFVNLTMFRIMGFPARDASERSAIMHDPMIASYLKNAFLAVHPDDRKRIKALFRSNYASHYFNTGNYRVVGRGGIEIWVNQDIMLREVRDGVRILYSNYRVVEREMELQKTLEQQLEQEKSLRHQAMAASEAKSEFLSRMSHDIRTPLNGIIGMTYLARSEKDPERIADYLGKIDTSSKFLLGLVNDILDMSKAESGKLELHPEPYPEKEFFRYLDSVIAPLCQEKSIRLEMESHPLPGYELLVDPLRINQVFFNLLSNAVKFTPEGGTVTCRLTEERISEHRAAFTGQVIDTGIGMSEEFLKVLFDPFTQENRKDISETRGTGLGLSIVKKIMDAMHGTVEVSSVRGQGTVFTVHAEAECIPSRSMEPAADPGAEDSFAMLAGRHVLVCEDHPLNREIAMALLQEKKMIVGTAEDGRLGIDAFRQSPIGFYDMILMDIRMPVMDGFQAARGIRALDRPDAKTVPIVAMTADAFSDDIEKCLEAGMDGHIAKPIDPQIMYQTLCTMMFSR